MCRSNVILGKPPRMTRDVRRAAGIGDDFDASQRSTFAKRRIGCCASRRSPTRRSSITIGDRTVGGMISRDPMVGPWQVPVSDVAVTLSDYTSTAGEAMAMGERTPLALLDAPASGRMAVAEAITNIAAADIAQLCRRAPVGELDGGVRRARRGRRSVRDREGGRRGVLPGARHHDSGRQGFAVDEDELDAKRARARKMVAPLSLIVSAFAPVRDVRRTLTPQLRTDRGDTALLLIDLGGGRNRLGGSCLAQVYGKLGREAPDCDDPQRARRVSSRRSSSCARPGSCSRITIAPTAGLFATLVEMAFAGPLRRRGRSWRDCAAMPQRRCSAKSSAPCCRFARPMRQPCARCSSATAWRRSRERDRRGHERGSRRDSRRRRRRARRSAHRLCAARGPRRASAWSSCATIPQCAREQFAAAIDPNDPGTARAA